jgi:hypothetical protein
MNNKVVEVVDYLIFGSGIGILGVVLFLERAGLFLYFGYVLVRVIGTILAISFFLWGMRFLKSHRLALFYSAVLISFALVFASWSLSMFDSSPRKHFYLAATQIKPGDSIDSVRKRMAQYQSWHGQQDRESFGFYNRPGISDVLVVHYDIGTGTVIDANLSLD